jgi:hypothetical protein
MSSKSTEFFSPISMLFELTRDDNPRLYDDLVRFNKGTKRINRLRFLAHEGLLAQNWVLALPPAGAPKAAGGHAEIAKSGCDALDFGPPSLTNQTFAEPLVE